MGISRTQETSKPWNWPARITVTILVISPHTSHRLQPLHRCLLVPFEHVLHPGRGEVLEPGRVVTVYQLVRLFGGAYLKAASQTTAINGFKKCGISPVDIVLYCIVFYL